MSVNRSLSDVEILVLLKAGDQTALTSIYKKYWEPLYLSIHHVLKDSQACEDIIQEIFIKLWDRRERLEINLSLKAYLHASCRYEVFRQIKTLKVRVDIFDDLHKRLDTSSAYSDIEHKEFVQQIDSIIASLPDKCREVYKLSREENLSHKEIALKLNISTKTVENHITKALSYLRNALGGMVTIEMITWWMKR